MNIGSTELNSSLGEALQGVNILEKSHGEFNSRGTCIPPKLLQLPVHHGEKFKIPSSPLDMLKIDTTDLDFSTLLCVNPYEINPLVNGSQSAPSSMTPQHTKEINYNLKQNEEELSGVATRTVKLEMEVFKDLTPFLPRTVPKCISDAVDELNTPLMDRDEEFDFTQTYACVSLQDLQPSESPFNFKVKNEQSELDAINVNNNEYSVIFKEDSTNKDINITNIHTNENSVVVNNNQNMEDNNSNNDDVIIFSPNHSDFRDGGIYCNYPSVKETPLFEHPLGTDVNAVQLTEVILNTNSNDSIGQCSNISIDTGYMILPSVAYDTPEESNSNSLGLSEYTNQKPMKKLKLDIDVGFFDSANTLTTPEVINTITNFEESNFNILDIVSEEEIQSVSDHLKLQTPSTSSNTFDFTSAKKKITEQKSQSITRQRKRKNDDDDEDYVPPKSLKSIGRKTIKAEPKHISYDSDSSCDDDYEYKYVSRRGRPPTKRSTETASLNPDAMRYRELRDKNNEASRRSRLKRKIKEVTLEKEADELYGKNIKLKAQVEQLESLVKNFRNNLFTIMLKK